ncbi:MAG: DUF2071 domain-containing protein [Myxococcales bacterium]
MRTALRHFALITFAVPVERLLPFIPADRFEVTTFEVGGEPRALLSAVPFLDTDFRFVRLAPFLRFEFAQTNHRVYVRDRRTGEPAVWFLGTTLGSRWVNVPRLLWRLPWHPARYRLDCAWDAAAGRYRTFRYAIDSAWCAGALALDDTGAPPPLLPGFTSHAEQQLVLTHPTAGFYRRLDGRLGSYSIWHDALPMTRAVPRETYFALYERLGLLSREEMRSPHSALIAREVEFDIHLPPLEVEG